MKTMSLSRRVLVVGVASLFILAALVVTLGMSDRPSGGWTDPVPTFFPGAQALTRKDEESHGVPGITVTYRLKRPPKDVVPEFNGRCRSFGLSPSGQAGYWVGTNSFHGGRNLRLTPSKGGTLVSYAEFFPGRISWWRALLRKIGL